MGIRVISPGLATSVQDLGRPGYYHLGIPISGGMDRYALRCANLLVGNAESAAVLEAVFLGPEIEFTRDATVSVTGANLPPKVDGDVREGWTSFDVKKGQVLSFEYLQAGARAYVAISGGIDVPVVLGSRSLYGLGALGGFNGRTLQAGDEIGIGENSGNSSTGRSIPATLRRLPGSPAELRVIPGIYWHRITEEAKANFFDDTWKVASEADRIGYRFQKGRPLSFIDREQPFGAGSDPSNIVDSCYPYGSIQVPGGTEPIVLHRDAVSGGGYCMIGTVISADMDFIGQLQPNMEVNFVEVDLDTALAIRQERNTGLQQVREID
ncbi:MAG: biotin-dependent carboxyltransferase [Gammaproteobacteria bacterium]|nr:biotin-dependent carboxyltransferase [Gammaproteobacteria bacterium]